jgi:hypothetical protein
MNATTYNCSRCRLEKPASEFAPSIVKRKTGGYCHACIRLRWSERDDGARNAEQQRKIAPKYKIAQKARGDKYRARVAASPDLKEKSKRNDRASGLLRRYGITLEQYNALLAAQGGLCACCHSKDIGRKGSRAGLTLFVDHAHASGLIRGLVCHKCNVGIGSLGDTAAGVQRALLYLTKPDTAGIGAGLIY